MSRRFFCRLQVGFGRISFCHCCCKFTTKGSCPSLFHRKEMSCVTGTEIATMSRGQIQLILGPMFSGKTTELVRRMRRFQVANHSCYMIKYAGDDRYSEESVATHDRQVTTAASAKTLSKLRKKALQYGVIGIDEGQFFPDIVEFCEDMANAGKTVIIAALDGTFQRKPFGSILSLVPLAESVVKLKAVCMICYRDAAFSKRLGSEKEVEVIGGAEKYMAVCRTCYSLPDRQTLLKNNVTPIRGSSDITIGRHLDLESPLFD